MASIMRRAIVGFGTILGGLAATRLSSPKSPLARRCAVESMDEQVSAPPIKELSRPQRRVLGTLVEKGLTTPEYYPLTLKALTTGCNQKNNRDPVSSYSEDEVAEVLDQLREMGLAAVVHTESGRTERFRHYLRKRFALSEPQVAILTELLLRGPQQLGELRTRASRMVSIDSQ